MALNVNIQLNVPALIDGEDWFVDATAWSNYWRGLNLVATFNPSANNLYVNVPYDNTLAYVNVASGVGMVASQAQFVSLLAAYAALNTNYQELRDAMKAAGFITNSQ